MAQSNTSTNCFRDLITLKNLGGDLSLFYTMGAFNCLLLCINISILYAVLGYMKPTIAELRKQTYIIMDNILLSYIPAGIRETIGCQPEIKMGGGGGKAVGKPGGKGHKGSKGATKTMTKTSTGTTKTGGTTGATAAASE
ncbi:hypothetical protein CRE_03990 [Caenorhabditis remanei]|uniref:Uncharacterized protein n=1 Tax=Caenorhabditis remanei TaxID=31234 RepID=E3LY84_CAERE|nr:hypothetical protein CRE_03990 [Caenorhabditis remanei]